jgi:signal transduction histidine kinase
MPACPARASTRAKAAAQRLAALAPQLEHAPARGSAGTSSVPRWLRAALGVPLVGKLAGAALLVVLVMTSLIVALHITGASDGEMMAILFVGLFATLVINLVLVSVALKPVADLEALSHQVLAGDLDARAQPSVLADRDIGRLGRSINLLLDALVSDRARMRRLAAEVIREHDEERARVARELHESVAQGIAAQMLQLGAAARTATDPALREQLLAIRAMTGTTMEELRALSQKVYPQMLDELGLGPALTRLARLTQERCGTSVDAAIEVPARRVSPDAAAVLYHVAEEALANACLHASAAHIRVALTSDIDTATLEVVDDGAGFDVAAEEGDAPTVGIFSMRQRVALVAGRFEITSTPGQGTRVVARVPVSTSGES